MDSVDERAVFRAKVLHKERTLDFVDLAVAAADATVAELDIRLRIPADGCWQPVDDDDALRVPGNRQFDSHFGALLV
jgi:hypothetical protein